MRWTGGRLDNIMNDAYENFNNNSRKSIFLHEIEKRVLKKESTRGFEMEYCVL